MITCGDKFRCGYGIENDRHPVNPVNAGNKNRSSIIKRGALPPSLTIIHPAISCALKTISQTGLLSLRDCKSLNASSAACKLLGNSSPKPQFFPAFPVEQVLACFPQKLPEASGERVNAQAIRGSPDFQLSTMLDDMTSEFPSEQGSSPTPVLESAQNAAEQLKTVVKEQATETGGKIKEEAKAAVSHLQAAGNRFATTQKDALASKAGEWAEALGAASQKLNDTEAPNLLAGPAESFAGELSRLANYLKDSDPAQIAEGLGQLARRKPELVFGGLFLTGLVAARFLKASGHRARVRDQSNLASTGSPYPFAHSQPAPSYE